MGVQVKGLTFNKQPWEKEFIDFSFEVDGKTKNISDFGLVVVSDGDRLSMNMSAPFKDETSEVNGVDGQLFWGTKYSASRRQFKLATDGMTQRQISEFKQFFLPGRYGKLIEANEFGKYCYARVAEQPVFSYLPFKNCSSLRGTTYSGNDFRGEITLIFVMDNPQKYAIENYISSDEPQEQTRLAAQCQIPYQNSWVEQTVFCVIGEKNKQLANGTLTDYQSSSSPFCIYNPSEIDTDAKITLYFEPSTDSNNHYNFIADDSCSNKNELRPYCRIMQSEMKFIGDNDTTFNLDSATEVFRFCAPYVIHAMNKAIDIIKNNGKDYVTMEEQLRDEIHHNKVLQWVINAIHREQNKVPNAHAISDCLTFFENDKDFIVVIDAISNTCSCQYYSASWEEAGTDENGQLKYEKKFSLSEENCGDITLSKNLKLKGGAYLDDNGNIASYHKLAIYQKDSIDKNTSVKLEYKYTYL